MESKYIRLPLGITKHYMESPLLKELLVVSTGYRYGHSPIGYHTDRQPNKECLIKYCTSGQGWLEVNGQYHTILPGDLILCRKDTHHIYGANKDHPWEAYWVYFVGDLAEHYINLLDATGQKNVLSIEQSTEFEKGFYQIRKTMEKGLAQHYMLHASNQLKLLISTLSEKMNTQVNKKMTFDDIIYMMQDHLDENLSLDDLALKMNMSKDHLTKVFYKKYGYTPINYFIYMKLQKACQILITTHCSIKETAAQVGYSDSLYFSRLFKKKLGYSPSEYRHKFSVEFK